MALKEGRRVKKKRSRINTYGLRQTPGGKSKQCYQKMKASWEELVDFPAKIFLIVFPCIA